MESSRNRDRLQNSLGEFKRYHESDCLYTFQKARFLLVRFLWANKENEQSVNGNKNVIIKNRPLSMQLP